MDISRASNEGKLSLCVWYFRGGFLFLPFLWAINFFWFFEDAFKKPPSDFQKEIRKYVIRSAIGAILWAIALGVWIYIFQVNRAGWGELGDRLSFVIPKGRA